jgi:hypothetical protein
MFRTPFVIGAVACAAALTGSMTALAAPVTNADLEGKKICWSDGGTPTYGKNGVYDESGFGHGTWNLAGGRLTVVASNGEYAGAITKENGSFHISGRINGQVLEASGKYCD